MNKHLLLLTLLAATSSAYGLDRPDGCLGTDYFGIRCMYMSAKSGHGGGADLDYIGPGVEINKHVLDNGEIGVDLSFDFELMKNQNRTNVYDLSDYNYTLGATVYRKGAFSPYFKFNAGYEKFELDHKNNFIPDIDEDTINLGGEIGVECHLTPGWSVTPFFAENADTDAKSNQWTWTAGVASSYWVNSLVGVRVTGGYSDNNGEDSFRTTFAAICHY